MLVSGSSLNVKMFSRGVLFIIVFLFDMLFLCPSRKQDFRELKQLQREEMKESIMFYAKIRIDKEAQEKKFEGEILVRSHDFVLGHMIPWYWSCDSKLFFRSFTGT